MTDETPRSVQALVLVCLTLVGCAFVDVPEDPQGGSSEQTIQPPVAALAGLELARQRAALRARVQDSLSRSPLNLKLRERPDGLTHIDVVRGFRNKTVVVRKPGGSFVQHCLSDADDALGLIEGGKE